MSNEERILRPGAVLAIGAGLLLLLWAAVFAVGWLLIQLAQTAAALLAG